MENEEKQLNWSQDVWDRIEQAVEDQTVLAKVAAKAIPPSTPEDATSATFPSDVVNPYDPDTGGSIAEGNVVEVVELSSLFSLTRQQVAQEEQWQSGATLAGRAAALTARGQDLLIFQGDDTVLPDGVVRTGFAGEGLALEYGDAPSDDAILVEEPTPGDGEWGDNTFEGVVAAIERLVAKNHYGPYSLILDNQVYADTHRLTANFVTPAARIKALLGKGGFYASTALPDHETDPPESSPRLTGLLLSTGGNAMDLVTSVETKVCSTGLDLDGRYYFRVVNRYAFRLKDAALTSAGVVQIQFMTASS